MTNVDWIIVAVTAVFFVVGYARGFVASAFSLGGFVLGAVLGSHLVPELLADGSASPYAPLFGLLGAIVGGFVFSAGFVSLARYLRKFMRVPTMRTFDNLMGATLTGTLALAVVWIIGAVALQTPGAGNLRLYVQRSAILGELNELLPPSGPVLNALARFDPFPQVEGSTADIKRPDRAIIANPAIQATLPSVVKVLGNACGLGLQGSGWVIAPELVVTNAHVVSGEQKTVVYVHDRTILTAIPVHFDPDNDIALLRVRGLNVPTLTLEPDPGSGTSAAIVGYPGNGPLDVRASRLGGTKMQLARDAYGEGQVQREITAFRGLVRPGNSGGPLVNSKGEVVATVFAATTGSSPTGGYGVANKVVQGALAKIQPTADTGPCVR